MLVKERESESYEVFSMNLQASVVSFEGIDWALAAAERRLRLHTVYVLRVSFLSS